jgi:hypothetical protein
VHTTPIVRTTYVHCFKTRALAASHSHKLNLQQLVTKRIYQLRHLVRQHLRTLPLPRAPIQHPRRPQPHRLFTNQPSVPFRHNLASAFPNTLNSRILVAPTVIKAQVSCVLQKLEALGPPCPGEAERTYDLNKADVSAEKGRRGEAA